MILKILIVEDDRVMQIGLEQFLKDLPQVEVIACVTNGYRAIEAATTLQPDLIIMDIGLPQLDGITATQRIKTKQPDIRVVMLTSHTNDREMVAALASGADAFCVKGTSLDQLEVAISCAYAGATYLDPQIARRVVNRLNQPSVAVRSGVVLSKRELEILKLIVEGRSNPEIAETLYLSLSTVKTHIRSIMNKLAVDDRVQAAVIALKSGLV